jgi:hypothetical protein
MAYEIIKRNRYYNELNTKAVHVSKNHYDDFHDFHIPLERMHYSNLHDWGVARGLEVSGTRGETEIIVNSGVAIDRTGQLISLSDKGHCYIGENPLKGEDYEVLVGVNDEVTVPVHLLLNIVSHAKKTFYITIQFSQIVRDEGVVGRLEQVPWVRLQPVDTFDRAPFDGKSIVLAIAVIDEDGKLAQLAVNPAELKNAANLPIYRRRLIGVEELRIQRFVNDGNKVQDMLSGKIGSGDTGGLKITVPDTQDSILFAREDGGDFKNLGINANVGIGLSSPSEKLEVSGTIKATAFVGNGYEITDIDGGKITTGIIDDTRIPTTIARESLFDPNDGHNHTGSERNGPKIKHSNLDDVLSVNTASINDDLTKHISDKLATGWQDHLTKFDNPHKITPEQIKALPIGGGAINGSLQVNGNIGIDGNVDIKATRINLDLEKNGGGQLVICNNPNDKMIYLEAFNSAGNGNADQLVLSGAWSQNVPVLKMNTDTFIVEDFGKRRIMTADTKLSNLSVDADSFVVKHSQRGESLRVDSYYAKLYVGAAGNEGDVFVRDSAGREVIHFNGFEAKLYLGKQGNAGRLRINDNTGKESVGIDGDTGNVRISKLYLGKQGNPGSLRINDNTGKESVGIYGDIGNVRISGHIIQDDWISPELLSPWIIYCGNGGGYNVPGYFRDKNGIVHLKGLVTPKENGEGTTIFILKDGYRPARQELQTVNSDNNFARCDIYTDGRVFAFYVKKDWFSLDGITFRADH